MISCCAPNPLVTACASCDSPRALSSARLTAAQAVGITIMDPARVRELATAICRLPRMPQGIINCPADRGGGYVLEFSAPSERFHAITLQASGCEALSGTGAGRARWVARTPLFWEQLAHLTGIASPARTQTDQRAEHW